MHPVLTLELFRKDPSVPSSPLIGVDLTCPPRDYEKHVPVTCASEADFLARSVAAELDVDIVVRVDGRSRTYLDGMPGSVEPSPNAVLREHGFFAYSGDAGDLYRKHDLAGWRFSLFGHGAYLLQQRSDRRYCGRHLWTTVKRWHAGDEPAFADFLSRFLAAADGRDRHGRVTLSPKLSDL
jgi:hypothetical protein